MQPIRPSSDSVFGLGIGSVLDFALARPKDEVVQK